MITPEPINSKTLMPEERIDRAKAELRASSTAAVDALNAVISMRLDSVDKAINMLSDSIKALPVLIDREVDQSAKFFTEKFNTIQLQFKERDTRVEREKIAAVDALNAALQAQKEAAATQNLNNDKAISKSEAGFNKDIESLKALLTTTANNNTNKIDDLTARLNRSEASINGARETRTDSYQGFGATIGVITTVVGVMALLATILIAFANHTPAQVIAPLPTPPAAPTPSLYKPSRQHMWFHYSHLF